LVKIPSVGSVTATARIAAIGYGGAFLKAREFVAWMRGFREKAKLLGTQQNAETPTCGRLFAQGARAVLPGNRTDSRP
jgi:transposase